MELKNVEADVVSLEKELKELKSQKQELYDLLKKHNTRYFVVKIPIPI